MRLKFGLELSTFPNMEKQTVYDVRQKKGLRYSPTAQHSQIRIM